MIRITPMRLIAVLIVLFPLVSLVQRITGPLTKILGLGIFVLSFIGTLTAPLSRRQFFALVGTVVLTISMIVQDAVLYSTRPMDIIRAGGTDTLFNLYVYFPVFCMFFLFLQTNFVKLLRELDQMEFLLRRVCFAWNTAMALSLLIPNAYLTSDSGERLFNSFAAGPHRFASCCLFIMAIAWWYANRTGKKTYYCHMILPLVGILLSGSRTYLVPAAIAALCVYYQILRSKKVFYLTLLPIIALFTVAVLLTPMGARLIKTLSGQGYGGYWFVLTSSRNVFWTMDMAAYLDQPIWKMLIGDGGTFVHRVNYLGMSKALWAHNDFIQVLLVNGAIGLFVYLYTIIGFSSTVIKANRNVNSVPWFFPVCYFMIWVFNAFFSGVILYPCAFYTMPFFLCAMFCRSELFTGASYTTPKPVLSSVRN